MEKLVWVCGECRGVLTLVGVDETPVYWDLHGVFTSEEKAIKACSDENFFIGPVNLDEELPKCGNWEGSYYPKGLSGCDCNDCK